MVNKQLSFERLEKRVVLDAATFSIVGQSPTGWVTINNYAVVGGTLRGGDNTEDGWPLKALADFTRDGVTDVLIRQAGGEWELHVNDGGELHAVPWFERPDLLDASEFDPEATNPNGTDPVEPERASDDAIIVGSADFDGDGQTDVALYDEVTGELWAAVARETYVQEQLWASLQPVLAQDRIFVGDFSGDGASDVLVGIDGGRWTLARSTAERDSLGASNWGAFPDYAWQYVVTGDFNGDEIQDVSAMAPDRTWWTWHGSPSGFGAAEYAGHWKMRDNWHDVGAADFNGDGRDDIIGRSEEGELWVGSSTEEGLLHTWRWGTGWVHQANWSSVTHVDFNEDGRVDQVGRAADGTWWLADNLGTNFRNEYITSTKGFTAVSEWHVVPEFSRERPINVSSFQALVPKDPLNPNLSPEGDDQDDTEAPATTPNVTPGAQFVHRNELVTVTIDENNYVVLLGGDINMLGVEVISRGGNLTPVDGSPDPFDFFLTNTSSSVVFGNLNRLELLQNGRMTLPVKWDPAAGVNDLVVNWGGKNSRDDSGQSVQGRAFLDNELVALISPEDVVTEDPPPIVPSDTANIAETDLHVSVDDGLIEIVNAPTDVTLIELKSDAGTFQVPPPGILPTGVIVFRRTDRHVLFMNSTPFELSDNRLVIPLYWASAAGVKDLDIRIGSASLDQPLAIDYL